MPSRAFEGRGRKEERKSLAPRLDLGAFAFFSSPSAEVWERLRKTGECEGAVIPPDSSGGYTDPLALLRYHEGGKCLS